MVETLTRMATIIATMLLLAYNGYTLQDVELVAQTIFWENWYTDAEKETAYWTGCVVKNRVESDQFPNTVHDVIYQKGQYSTTKYFFTKEVPEECYEMAKRILAFDTDDVPKEILFQARFKQGKVWREKNGEIFCYGN